MSNPTLHWLSSTGEEHVFTITRNEVIIGRKGDADIVLGNQNVSRHHARIVLDGASHVIEDLGSVHGSFVNSAPVKRQPLRDKDRIELGKDRVELYYFTRAGCILNSETPDTPRSFEHSLNELGKLLPSAFSDLEKISCVLDFQYQWEQAYTPDAAFIHILRSALKISGAERGFVMVRRGDSLNYSTGMDGHGRLLSEKEFQTSQSVVQEVVMSGKPVVMVEGIKGAFAEQKSIMAMNLRAIACLPLKGLPSAAQSMGILGILYLDSKKTMHSLSGLDQKILSKLADEAATVLERIEMIKGIEQRRKLEKELALAEETQRSLLPQTLPNLDGFRLCAFSKPTRYVGGDFYDWIEGKEGGFTGVLADVSGKGVAASLLSSMTLGCLEMQLRSGVSLVHSIDKVNRFLCERTLTGRFVTMFVFTLNREGEGEFVNAGHNPVYLFRAATREIEELQSNSLFVGAFSFAVYESTPLRLDAGDVMVVYSDGLTEAENPAAEMLGEDRVKSVILAEAPHGAERLEQQLLETIRSFTKERDQTDDITLMIVEKRMKGTEPSIP